MAQQEDEKVCTKCRKPKSLTAFSSDKRRSDGKQSQCRECQNLWRAQWNRDNRERYLQQKRADAEKHKAKRSTQKARWYQANKEHCLIRGRESARRLRRIRGCKQNRRGLTEEEKREEANARAKAYIKANPEKVKASRQVHYQANKERMRRKARLWQLKNPLAFKAQMAKRRARKRNATICDLTCEQWVATLERFGHRCAYCYRPLLKPTQDHIIPLAAGGNHTMDNIVPACRQCNASKENKSLWEWAATRFLRFTTIVSNVSCEAPP